MPVSHDLSARRARIIWIYGKTELSGHLCLTTICRLREVTLILRNKMKTLQGLVMVRNKMRAADNAKRRARDPPFLGPRLCRRRGPPPPPPPPTPSTHPGPTPPTPPVILPTLSSSATSVSPAGDFYLIEKQILLIKNFVFAFGNKAFVPFVSYCTGWFFHWILEQVNIFEFEFNVWHQMILWKHLLSWFEGWSWF